MFRVIDSWLKDRPIETIILSLFLGWAILRFASFAATLWGISPQRLDRWVLKALLSQTEAKRSKIIQISEELPRLILECFLSLLYLGLALVFFISSCLFSDPRDHSSFSGGGRPCRFLCHRVCRVRAHSAQYQLREGCLERNAYASAASD